MTNEWRHLPAPARPIAAATVAAVGAARRQERVALTEAVAELAAQDQAQTGLILGTAVRVLLEARHPDGLDADDVREVLSSSVRAAAAWCPEVDPQVLLFLLANALQVWEDDGSPPPKPDALGLHAALLISHLTVGEKPEEVLTAALGEIERAQLND
ncbi:hypothetical protein [Symbioplanes lichenis]|uniref:hypothetical protein n=1 Tax=Symbioplanes lichenis TaxID=1629072 RepID=UPI002739ABBB|nr:hypothetical protein [Actinoplanes lichenis]